MKFNAHGAPLIRQPEVGDVFRAHGGRGTTAFWVVLSLGESGRMAHVVGIDGEGVVVSTASYAGHVFESRPRVGRCEDVLSWRPPIVWEISE